LTAEKYRLEQELTLVREEIRIKDARMARLPAHRRPQYTPVERMAILELKAARAWSLTQAAEAFLVTASILGGFWTSWLPFALPQCWPFCWWVAVVLDHYSRRMMGFAVFARQPTSVQVRALLARTIHLAGRAPKYLICDKGSQFWCPGFKSWCKRRKIKPRFGAIGQHGSIAVIERFILTMKTLCTRVTLVPVRSAKMREELQHFQSWYNELRPHTTLRRARISEALEATPVKHVVEWCRAHLPASVQSQRRLAFAAQAPVNDS
jgi:transposase InsO family protein